MLEAAQAAVKYVDVEVRLDPKTYRVRQILVIPRDFPANDFSTEVLGFRISSGTKFKPFLVVDLGEPSWVGLAFLNQAGEKPSLDIETDLWLSRATTPAQPLKPIEKSTGQKGGALLKFTAALKHDLALVPIAFRTGRIEFLQKSAYESTGTFGPVCVGESGALEPLRISDIDVKLNADTLKERVVNLLSKPKGESSGGFGDSLETYVEITSEAPTVDVDKRKVSIGP